MCGYAISCMSRAYETLPTVARAAMGYDPGRRVAGAVTSKVTSVRSFAPASANGAVDGVAVHPDGKASATAPFTGCRRRLVTWTDTRCRFAMEPVGITSSGDSKPRATAGTTFTSR